MRTQIAKFSSNSSLNLTDDLSVILDESPGPFTRFSGFTFTSVSMSQDAPHGGEMHPDGDEIVYVISGKIEVTLELESDQTVNVEAGEGVIIPRGIWHKVHVVEPVELVTISPGPGFEFRELNN